MSGEDVMKRGVRFVEGEVLALGPVEAGYEEPGRRRERKGGGQTNDC